MYFYLKFKIDKAKQAKKTAHGHAQMKEKQQHKMTEGNEEALIERGLEGQSVRVEVGTVIEIDEIDSINEPLQNQLNQIAISEAEDILAPVMIEREVLAEELEPANQDLIERGLPERIVQGPLTVTDAGYVQLNSIEERMILVF